VLSWSLLSQSASDKAWNLHMFNVLGSHRWQEMRAFRLANPL
jgi:hypothetical protein